MLRYGPKTHRSLVQNRIDPPDRNDAVKHLKPLGLPVQLKCVFITVKDVTQSVDTRFEDREWSSCYRRIKAPTDGNTPSHNVHLT